MEKYEKNISLKTVYLTIVKRFILFILIFVPVVTVSFVVTRFILTKAYKSSVSTSRGTSFLITTAQWTVMQRFITDTTEREDPAANGAIVKAVEVLKEENITISINEIINGLSFDTMVNNSASFSFNFTSNKKSIVQPVLKAVSESAEENLQATTGDFKYSKIISPASSAKDVSKNNTYFIIALAAGFVLALGVPFIYEIVADEVYDREDIEYLGCSGFELDASKRKEA